MWRVWHKFHQAFPKTPLNKFYSQASNNYIDICDEVRHALQHKKPVVALESTIITHGMPYPNNLQCALEVETIVRERGATPATVAILGGRIKVGLGERELTQLADVQKNPSVKTSRRDLGYVLANKYNGGTTVAGTLIVASEVGIRVFATGGIGGVHREGEQTFDISADLTELGRSPVAVVSSGVKSILDIPKTLEYLETQGVFVATFGENKAFPAFYCRTSGHEAPYNVGSAEEAAAVISSHFKLGLQSGLLFAVPVPEEFALDEEEMNAVIEQAMDSAKKCGVSGKQITPYLLGHIAEITKGSSLRTNIALIKNNAKTAADISVQLAQLTCDRPSTGNEQNSTILGATESRSQPVVIGGSIIDCCATLKGKDIFLDGRIHDANFKNNAGGVGRNIAEAMGKLGYPPAFISVVGNDSHGQYLNSLLQSQSSRHVKILPNGSTAQCTIIFDMDGDCKMLVGNMDVHQEINADMVNQHEQMISRSPLLILDANLSMPTLGAALKLAEKYNVPVFFEPTDVPIADKPFKTGYGKAIKYITPNLLELQQIAKTLNIPLPPSHNLNQLEEAAFIAKLAVAYVPTVIVTLGSGGLLIARQAEASDPLLSQNRNRSKNCSIKIRHYPAERVQNIVNVSGAGDCLASGLIVSMLAGLSEEQCVKIGYAAAQASLYSESAVPVELFDDTHPSWSSKAAYETLLL